MTSFLEHIFIHKKCSSTLLIRMALKAMPIEYHECAKSEMASKGAGIGGTLKLNVSGS